MKKTLLAALIGSAVLLTGCQDKEVQALFPKKEVLINKDEDITYSVEKEKEFELEPGSKSHLTYKVVSLNTDIKWLDAILRDITLEGEGELNALVDLDVLKEEMVNNYYGNIARFITLDFVGQKERLATFSRYKYSHDFGTHGMYSQNYFNIDLIDHKILKLQDVFQNNQTMLLDMLWENYLGTTDQPFIEKNNLYIPENFYFAPDGVHFVFPPYAIGPFSKGVMEIVLWWGELTAKNLLSQDFIKKYNPPVDERP